MVLDSRFMAPVAGRPGYFIAVPSEDVPQLLEWLKAHAEWLETCEGYPIPEELQDAIDMIDSWTGE